jgi:hypothetical protein
MGKVLTADEILNADDLPIERVEVKEWGGDVFVRTMTGLERDKWEESVMRFKPRRVNGKNIQEAEFVMANAKAKMLAKVLSDDNGNSLFSTDDVDRLGKKSAAALDRCFQVAQRLNHLTDDDMEELVKNSNGGTSVDSGSA